MMFSFCPRKSGGLSLFRGVLLAELLKLYFRVSPPLNRVERVLSIRRHTNREISDRMEVYILPLIKILMTITSQKENSQHEMYV